MLYVSRRALRRLLQPPIGHATLDPSACLRRSLRAGEGHLVGVCLHGVSVHTVALAVVVVVRRLFNLSRYETRLSVLAHVLNLTFHPVWLILYYYHLFFTYRQSNSPKTEKSAQLAAALVFFREYSLL